MLTAKIGLGLVFATAALPADAVAAPPETVTPSGCYVHLIEEAEVAAEVEGVVREMKVQEGDPVGEEDLLVQIDDTRAQVQKKAAQARLNVATKKAENTTRIEYAEAAKDVALRTYQRDLEACKVTKNAIPEAEVDQHRLEYTRAWWEVKQATEDKEIAGYEKRVSEAEVAVADESIDRHKIKSPLDGVVVELNRNRGEWVKPGDPVVRVVRMDRLWVKGMVGAAEVSPGEVDGQPVQVVSELARGRKETFAGKVVFARPLVQSGEYQVWAEVENRKEGGHWLLRPGLEARMTIQLTR